jgi:hypothetical protein
MDDGNRIMQKTTELESLSAFYQEVLPIDAKNGKVIDQPRKK